MKYYVLYRQKFMAGLGLAEGINYAKSFASNGATQADTPEVMSKIMNDYAATYMNKYSGSYTHLEYFPEQLIPSSVLNQYYNNV